MGKIPSREEQEGVREFDNPRSRSGQEARVVGSCESEDFKGDKGAVGKVSSTGEEVAAEDRRGGLGGVVHPVLIKLK